MASAQALERAQGKVAATAAASASAKAAFDTEVDGLMGQKHAPPEALLNAIGQAARTHGLKALAYEQADAEAALEQADQQNRDDIAALAEQMRDAVPGQWNERLWEALWDASQPSALYRRTRDAITNNHLAERQVERAQRKYGSYVARNSATKMDKHLALSAVAAEADRERAGRGAVNRGLNEAQQSLTDRATATKNGPVRGADGKTILPLSKEEKRELLRLTKDQPRREAEDARLAKRAKSEAGKRDANVRKNGPRIAKELRGTANALGKRADKLAVKLAGLPEKHPDRAKLEAERAELWGAMAAANEEAERVEHFLRKGHWPKEGPDGAAGAVPGAPAAPPAPPIPPGCPPDYKTRCCEKCGKDETCVCPGSSPREGGGGGQSPPPAAPGPGAGPTIEAENGPPPPPPPVHMPDAVAVIGADGQAVARPVAGAMQPATRDCRALMALVADLWDEYRAEHNANDRLERDSKTWQACPESQMATAAAGPANPCVQGARAWRDQNPGGPRFNAFNARGIHGDVREGMWPGHGYCTAEEVEALKALADTLAGHTLVLHAASVVRRLAALSCLFAGLAARHPSTNVPSFGPDRGLHHKEVARPFEGWSKEWSGYLNVAVHALESVCAALGRGVSAHEAWGTFGEVWLPYKGGLDALAGRVRSYIAAMVRVEDDTLAAQRTLRELLLGEAAGAVALRALGYLLRTVRVHLRRGSAPSRLSVPEPLRSEPEDWTPDEAAAALDRLALEGHAPQRHEGHVRVEEHAKRIHDGIDPATGTALDIETKRSHKRVPTSSSFTSEEAMAQAANVIKRDKKYLARAAARVEDTIEVEVPLSEALGYDYLGHVEGYTRKSVNGLALRAVDYTDGAVWAIMAAVKTPDKARIIGYKLLTMYPISKRGGPP